MRIRSAICPVVGALLVNLAFSGLASAAPVTFFGVDVNSSNLSNLTSQPNSDAARNNFFANLSGVGTETFNGFSAGQSPPLAISFQGAGTATINGSAVIATGVTGTNQYGLFDGVQASPYLNTTTGQFQVNFSSPVAAFGFYGIDLESLVTLQLTATGGAMSTLDLPPILEGLASGSIIYFGFYDTATTYQSIAITNPTNGGDIYAFDNFSVGSAEQVIPVDVPEPATLALFGAGLAGLGALRRRRKAKA